MRIRPQIVVGIGVFFSSLSAIIIRLSDAPALAIASYRMVFATLILTPFMLRERVRGAHREDHGSQPAGVDIRTIVLSVVSGALLSLHFATWITSLAYTSVASSTVLVTTHPLIVAIGGMVLLGERITLRSALFIVTALVGSVVLVWGGVERGESAALGNLLAVVGAITVSGYMIIGRVVRQRLSVNHYTYIVYSVAAILLVAYALMGGVPLYPYPLRELLLFLALAVFCTLLGHSLFNWALRFLKPTVVSTTILGEPVIASVLAVILFGEVPTVFTIIGGAIILTSIYFFVRQEARSV